MCLLKVLLQHQTPYFGGLERQVLGVLLESRADESKEVNITAFCLFLIILVAAMTYQRAAKREGKNLTLKLCIGMQFCG